MLNILAQNFIQIIVLLYCTIAIIVSTSTISFTRTVCLGCNFSYMQSSFTVALSVHTAEAKDAARYPNRAVVNPSSQKPKVRLARDDSW
jgi:hypothetical protein